MTNEVPNPEKKNIPIYVDDADIAHPTPREYEEFWTEPGRKPSVFIRLAEFLANDVVAGLILIIAAVLALICANFPGREYYFALAEWVPNLGQIGDTLHLNMSIDHWARDGILTVFFFAVGLELKEEFVHGSLHNPKTAALPILAALFGMIGPACVYLSVTAITGDNAWHGWAIPSATDIAFAVAILQIFGRGLPLAARTFLLTLAVADDLGGIIVIALFYGEGQSAWNYLFLIPCLALAALFSFLCRRRWHAWWNLIPLALLVWYFMHISGIHATIAGVLLGMVVPANKVGDEKVDLTEDFLETINPISAGLAVPIFAFFAAGVNVVDVEGGALAVLTHPVALSVTAALPIGKMLGIFGSVFVMEKFTPLQLGKGVTLGDIFPISLVAGIGFTVALLISHLAFVGDADLTQAGSIGVVMGTLTSVVLSVIALRIQLARRAKHGTLDLCEEAA